MVRFTVLSSGSKGNSTVVAGGRTRILVDAGLSCRELFRRMKLAEEKPESLSAILITHEHADHVAGISVTARKLGIPVYFTEATHNAWMRWVKPHRQMTYAQWMEQMQKKAADRLLDADSGDAGNEAEPEEAQSEPEQATAPDSSSQPPSRKQDPTWLPAVEFFAAGKPFSIGDIDVSPFTTPHDAADPVGFVFQSEGVRIGYATDLGYITPNVKAQFQRLDLLLLEANHDLEMLRDGPYPWAVKQRVLSRVGHLSNDDAANFLLKDYDGSAAYIVLAHLSENNNHPDLARVAAEQALLGRGSLLTNRTVVASQHEPLEPLNF